MTKLRYLATVTNSNVDKVINTNEVPVRLCNYVDVYKNDFIQADMEFAQGSATSAELEKFHLKVGDVIITKDSEDRSDIGVPALVHSTDDDLVCGYHLTMLRADPRRVAGKFLFWALQSKPVRESFSNASFGVTRFGLSLSGIKDADVPTPDLDSQRRIADFLNRETGHIDQLIEKKQRLVELLPEKEKAMVSRLVLEGDRNDVEQSGTTIEWRGTTPSHWKESRLKAHFRIQKRQGYDDLTVLSVYREYGVIEKSSRDDNINKTPLDLSKYQLVQPGDLVINKMKAWQGSLGISRFRGITSPDYLVMTPLAKHVPEYMHHLLRARPMPSVYQMISNGIRTDQWRMEPEKFLALPIFLPPIEEQSRIARKIEDELTRLRLIAEVVTNSIDRLREYRAALITTAVAGQVDVTSWGKRGNTDRHLDAIEQEMAS